MNEREITLTNGTFKVKVRKIIALGECFIYVLDSMIEFIDPEFWLGKGCRMSAFGCNSDIGSGMYRAYCDPYGKNLRLVGDNDEIYVNKLDETNCLHICEFFENELKERQKTINDLVDRITHYENYGNLFEK